MANHWTTDAPHGKPDDARDLLERLGIERQCLQVFNDYFFFLDLGERHRAGECFTQNVEVEFDLLTSAKSYHGLDEWLAYLDDPSNPPKEMSAHLAGQQIFDWSGARPKLKAYVMTWLWFEANASQGKQRPADFGAIAYLQDEFERVEGKWLIASRRVRPAGGPVAIGAAPAR